MSKSISVDTTLTSTINILLTKKQYEDILFLYSLNYKKLIPFFQFLKSIDKKDKIILLEYIMCSRGPSTMVLKKVINSSYFYTSLGIDKEDSYGS